MGSVSSLVGWSQGQVRSGWWPRARASVTWYHMGKNGYMILKPANVRIHNFSKYSLAFQEFILENIHNLEYFLISMIIIGRFWFNITSITYFSQITWEWTFPLIENTGILFWSSLSLMIHDNEGRCTHTHNKYWIAHKSCLKSTSNNYSISSN